MNQRQQHINTASALSKEGEADAAMAQAAEIQLGNSITKGICITIKLYSHN